MSASTAHTPQRPPPVLHLGAGDFLDTATAAELLACSTRTVTNLISRGHLRAVRLGPGRTAYRIPTDALLSFITRHGHHEPGDVAASPDAPAAFTPAPVLLLETRTPEGLRVVTPYRPPDPGQEGG